MIIGNLRFQKWNYYVMAISHPHPLFSLKFSVPNTNENLFKLLKKEKIQIQNDEPTQ